MGLSFDLQKRDVIDDNHSVDIYRFNLARNHALLAGDSAAIRRFYQQKAMKVGANDIYKHQELERSFFFNARLKNAFVYAGLIPLSVESIVRLVASAGFQVNSPLQGGGDFETAAKKDIDDYIQSKIERIDLQGLFEDGVYTESGLGDFALRISHDKSLSDEPIVDFIEPQFIEPHYKRGMLTKIIIKESTDELSIDKGQYKQIVEVHEIYTKEDTKSKKYPGEHIVIRYKFYQSGKEIKQQSNAAVYNAAKAFWGISDMMIELPFKEFPVLFKKNNKKSRLYRNERGVPDIQGLDTIEDALSESLSNLVDVIRKAAPKTFVNEDLLPSSISGETEQYSAFDHEYLIIRGGIADPTKLLVTTEHKIEYNSYLETAKYLISHACNKLGVSPTTIGVTGLESINSSSESQDAREKPSLRTRDLKLKGWKVFLQELLNRYFQYLAFVKGEKIEDYSELLNVSFNEYINPATENIIDVLTRAVAGQVYSVEVAVEKNFIHEGKDYTLEDIIIEAARIRGITPESEMVLLGIVESPEPAEASTEDGNPATENINKNKATEP